MPTTPSPVQIGKLIFDPTNPNNNMVVVAPESWDVLPDEYFVAEYEYTGLRQYCVLTGRTRQKWGRACPTVERYYIDTVVIDGAIMGQVGKRNGAPWATRPENLTTAL